MLKSVLFSSTYKQSSYFFEPLNYNDATDVEEGLGLVGAVGVDAIGVGVVTLTVVGLLTADFLHL